RQSFAHFFLCARPRAPPNLHSFPTRRSSDLKVDDSNRGDFEARGMGPFRPYGENGETMQYYQVAEDLVEDPDALRPWAEKAIARSEEHTSELQSPDHLVCRLLLEKKNKYDRT